MNVLEKKLTICKENLKLPVLLLREKLQVFLALLYEVLFVQDPLQTLKDKQDYFI